MRLKQFKINSRTNERIGYMKKLTFKAVIFLAILFVNIAVGMDISKWKYCSKISVEQKKGVDYAKAQLTKEIYNVANPDLFELRIVDPNSVEIPYLLVKQDYTPKRKTIAPLIINRATDDKNCYLVTLDFGNNKLRDSIKVETEGKSFRRKVTVMGSNDNADFNTVVNGAYVFAVDNKEKSRFSEVKLPLVDYRYLKVKVEPMASEKQSPVIKAVLGFESRQEEIDSEPVEMVFLDKIEDAKKKISIYDYDLKYKNLPVNEIRVLVYGDTFFRRVKLQGRDSATRMVKIRSEDNRERYREEKVAWKDITTTSIYCYRSDSDKKSYQPPANNRGICCSCRSEYYRDNCGCITENKTIKIPPQSKMYRYLRVVIENQDNRPLEIRSMNATMLPAKIIFANSKYKPDRLLVGAKSVSKPHYDIAKIISEPLKVKAVCASLGALEPNPFFEDAKPKVVPWSQRHKSLLLIILVTTTLILFAFILKSLSDSLKSGNS